MQSSKPCWRTKQTRKAQEASLERRASETVQCPFLKVWADVCEQSFEGKRVRGFRRMREEEE